MRKSLAVLLTAALAMSVFAAFPAEAKKKKKKKKKPAVCAPYAPGGEGVGAETLVVTDSATAETPLTQALTFDPYFLEGIDGAQPTQTVNVQVDSAAKTAGLYVTFEFDSHRDYDLFARWPDGSEAASSHGFNPLIDTQGQPEGVDQSNTATNHAGETTATSENIVGLITPDCGGYTVQFYNYFGEGGDFEAKLWLGEGKEEPLAPGS
jgi:hypothetical protein